MAGPPFRTAADRAAALAFFKGHDDGHALFHQVVAAVAEAGPFELTATGSRVALTARTRFAWCHKANDDGSLWLGFLLPRRVESPRLRTGRAGGRWSHHLKVRGPQDLDAELVGWLRESYAWDVGGAKPAKPKVTKAKAARGVEAMADWTCPACGQSFTHRNQSHSCARQEVEELFEEFPAALAVAHAVQRFLGTLGPVEMAATKTQVSFRHRVRFAWVWMPRQSAGSGPDVPVVSFGLRRRLQSPRVWRAFLARRDVWTHHVLAPRARDVDAELKGWLREAFETVGPGARAAKEVDA